jgi:hypothetical protein
VWICFGCVCVREMWLVIKHGTPPRVMAMHGGKHPCHHSGNQRVTLQRVIRIRVGLHRLCTQTIQTQLDVFATCHPPGHVEQANNKQCGSVTFVAPRTDQGQSRTGLLRVGDAWYPEVHVRLSVPHNFRHDYTSTCTGTLMSVFGF